jgi:hypothetical protein
MRWLIPLLTILGVSAALSAQQPAFNRLPLEVLDVTPPSARVAGPPGSMTIRDTRCRSVPAAEVRQRIVNLSVQEWAFFGSSIVDQSDDEESEPGVPGPRGGWRRLGGGPESARVAASIAGFWAVAPGGAWILENQNTIWSRPGNASGRWRFPWSAAFISWVMCESGLSSADQFQRAIAHHTYIDQAIRARDGAAPRTAFTAHEAGDAEIAAGDLLCTARRPVYRTLADRRRQMGEGARTHCDVVVQVDEAAGHILAIGGNVRGTVGLKVLPAVRAAGRLRVQTPPDGSRARPIFAHLKLHADYGGAGAFHASPTLQAMGCATDAIGCLKR